MNNMSLSDKYSSLAWITLEEFDQSGGVMVCVDAEDYYTIEEFYGMIENGEVDSACEVYPTIEVERQYDAENILDHFYGDAPEDYEFKDVESLQKHIDEWIAKQDPWYGVDLKRRIIFKLNH